MTCANYESITRSIYSNHKRTTEIHINVNLDIKPSSHARKQINKNISNSS